MSVPECGTLEEIYSFMMQRETKGCVLYRIAADAAAEKEAKALLEKLAQRGDAYLEKLHGSRPIAVFTNRPCKLPDRSFFSTLEEAPRGTGVLPPEILMFALCKENEDYRVCKEAAQRSRVASNKKLWLALAEEERRQRLELESFYEKEVIWKI